MGARLLRNTEGAVHAPDGELIILDGYWDVQCEVIHKAWPFHAPNFGQNALTQGLLLQNGDFPHLPSETASHPRVRSEFGHYGC